MNSPDTAGLGDGNHAVVEHPEHDLGPGDSAPYSTRLPDDQQRNDGLAPPNSAAPASEALQHHDTSDIPADQAGMSAVQGASEPGTSDDLAHADDTVTFTRSEWEHEPTSEAFGVKKKFDKPKEKVPGVKPVLIFHDSFIRAKRRNKGLSQFQPTVDLQEVISAMVDVCDADPALMARVRDQIITRRERQLAQLRGAIGASGKPGDDDED